MTTPLQVGITGGIGTGKSIVCKIFSTLGVPVYDADSRAKTIMTTDGIVIAAIKKEFGNLSFFDDGTLNRKHLATIAFEDTEKLKKLNAIVHPAVEKDYKNWVLQQTEKPYLLKEAALLLQTESYKKLDKIIVVAAPENLRINRVLKRDPHRNEQEIRNIIKNQLPQEEMITRANYILINDEAQLLITQVLALHNKLVKIGSENPNNNHAANRNSLIH